MLFKKGIGVCRQILLMVIRVEIPRHLYRRTHIQTYTHTHKDTYRRTHIHCNTFAATRFTIRYLITL